MTAARLDALASALGAGWTVTSRGRGEVLLRFNDGEDFEAGARRCTDGRLRDAYPVSAHDVEIYTTAASGQSSHRLAELTHAILAADPYCRRIVFGAPAGDSTTLAAVREAGFRHVVDVDVPGAELSLLVAEPSWVTGLDAGLDRVPGT